MGFGIKTDFSTGRQLDLNKTYKVLIKPVVENKGFICIRADEIKHSGSIDVMMYEELLGADIVIADLSTLNPNAIYELGVRHALRPKSTIVIAEDKLPYPFDLNHILISKYAHLGHAIDYEEVERFRQLLGDTIDQVVKTKKTDSPVYTYLKELMPPIVKKNQQAETFTHSPAKTRAEAVVAKQIDSLPEMQQYSLSEITELGETALEKGSFIIAKDYFAKAYELFKALKKDEDQNDSYIVQRLALCMYKSHPLDNNVLNNAMELLHSIGLKHSNDTETVVLAGRIERRIYNNTLKPEHLENAILLFQRGYFLLHNRYNGINLALLLTRRVDTDVYSKPSDKVTDLVWANRIRKEVIEISNKEFNKLISQESQPVFNKLPNDDQITDNQEKNLNYNKFWILANTAHAYYGLGQMDPAKEFYEAALNLPYEKWMINTVREDFKIIYTILSKYSKFVEPAWNCADITKLEFAET